VRLTLPAGGSGAAGGSGTWISEVGMGSGRASPNHCENSSATGAGGASPCKSLRNSSSAGTGAGAETTGAKGTGGGGGAGEDAGTAGSTGTFHFPALVNCSGLAAGLGAAITPASHCRSGMPPGNSSVTMYGTP